VTLRANPARPVAVWQRGGVSGHISQNGCRAEFWAAASKRSSRALPGQTDHGIMQSRCPKTRSRQTDARIGVPDELGAAGPAELITLRDRRHGCT